MANQLRVTAACVLLMIGAAGVLPAYAADFGAHAAGGDERLIGRDRAIVERDVYGEWNRAPRPHGRPVNGGPGYVGSDYGLGKPAFTGLGSRPDWGVSD